MYEADGGSWAEKDTKNHQVRRIALDDLGLEVLRRHRVAVDQLAELGVTVAPNAFLFSSSPAGLEPIRPDVLSKFTKRVADKAGVNTHLHPLRHFSATQAIAAGFDAVTVGARRACWRNSLGARTLGARTRTDSFSSHFRPDSTILGRVNSVRLAFC